MQDVNFQASILVKTKVSKIDDDYRRNFFKIIYEVGDNIEFRLFGTDLVNRRFWARRTSNEEVIEPIDGFVSIKDISELTSWNQNNYNIYAGINPRIAPKKSSPWEKSGAANVKLCRWLFADFDPDKMPWKNIPKKELLDFAKCKIKEAGLPTATLIISKGHGYHFYWKLNESLTPEKWKPIQTDLIYTLEADSKADGLDRVMRPPGFKNTKSEPFVKCRFEEYTPAAVYDLELITKSLKEAKKEERPKRGEEKAGYKYAYEKLDILDWLVKAKGITADKAQEFSKTQQDYLYISCPMPFHEGADKHPSLKINVHGKHKGICTCFSCPIRYEGKEYASYTIMEVLLALLGYAPFDSEAKEDLALEMEAECSGFIKYDIFKLNYPADNLDVLLKRYFSIPEGEKEAGMYHLWWYRGRHYYHPKDSYITYDTAALRDFIWDKLKKGKYWKKQNKVFQLESFPVDKFRVNQIMDVVREYRNVEAKKIGYAPGEMVRDAFYIDKTRPNLVPIENLLVIENGILNVKTRKIITKSDPNLFSATTLPVKYDQSLPKPIVNIKALEQNLGNKEQINEHYKRDAFICLPYPPTHIHVFLVCVGLTGSGKGTDVRFKKLWLGKHNWEEMELNVLGEKWGLQNIPGVLVIFISDSDEDEVGKQKMALASLRIKKLTGNDTLCVRLPGGIWLNDIPSESLKIVYLTTNIPKFANSSDEIARRLNVEEYKSQWIEEEDISNFPDRTGSPDPDLEKNMAKEVDAYFTHCVIDIGMKKLFEDMHFKVTEETKEKKKEMLFSFAIYARFLTDVSEKVEGESMLLETLHHTFFPWCVNNAVPQEEYTNRKTKENISTRTLSVRIKKMAKMEIVHGTYKESILSNRRLTKYGKELLQKWENQTWQVSF